jgi:hypothetical protein
VIIFLCIVMIRQRYRFYFIYLCSLRDCYSKHTFSLHVFVFRLGAFRRGCALPLVDVTPGPVLEDLFQRCELSLRGSNDTNVKPWPIDSSDVFYIVEMLTSLNCFFCKVSRKLNKYRSTGLQLEISVSHSYQSIKKSKPLAHMQFLLNNGIRAWLLLVCSEVRVS